MLWEEGAESLRCQFFQLIGLHNRQAGAFDGDPLVAAELVEQPRDGFARGAGHVGDLFVGEGHGEADFVLAVARGGPENLRTPVCARF